MIGLQASRGGAASVGDSELWDESRYRRVLKTIAADTHVPLVDSLQIVADAKTKVARDLEARLNLSDPPSSPDPPPPPDPRAPPTTLVFRVSPGTFPVNTAMSILGAHAKL